MKAFTVAAGLLGLALLGGVMAYWPALAGPFLLDDFDAIHPLVAHLKSGAGWWQVLLEAPHHIRPRWLSNASFLATQVLSGQPVPPSPWAFKATNLGLHLACALLVFLLGRALARRWGKGADGASLAGAIAASLFVLHPLLLSTVMYPVQRMAQLATLFSLAAVLAYVHWRGSIAESPTRRSAAGLAAVLGAMAAAVLSKESGALVPLLLLVVEATTFRVPAAGTVERRRFETGFGLACAAPLVLGVVLLAVRAPGLLAAYADRDFTLGERLLTQVHVVAGYLGQIAWPRIDRMGLYHDDVAVVSSAGPATWALLAGFALVLALAIAWRRRFPAAAFAALWFVASHAMESTFIPLELVFEHRNYLAIVGLAIGLGVALARLGPRRAVPAALVLLALLGWQTRQRAQDWRDYPNWIRAEVAHHPDSLRAGTDLVNWLAARNDLPGAASALDTLRARFPDHAQPVLLSMWLRCRATGPISVQLDGEDLATLRGGRFGKDAFHVYGGLRDARVEGTCNGVAWQQLALASGAMASNPRLATRATARAAWNRAHAQALAQAGDWPGAGAAIQRALDAVDNDPRDWMLLMEASLRTRDLAGYSRARLRLAQLLPGGFGNLAHRVSLMDDAARRLAAQSAPR